MTLRRRAEEAAEHIVNVSCESELPAAIADAIEREARRFAERALRHIYEVDDADQRSSDGERARGSYQVKYEFRGRPNVEWRHYRKDFEAMIAKAIEAAGEEET